MTDDLVTAAVKKLPAWQEAALAEIELAIARRYPSSSEQKLIGDKLISEYFIARLHKVLLKLKVSDGRKFSTGGRLVPFSLQLISY